MDKIEGFEEFLDAWEQLPRAQNAILPSKKDITPANFGHLMPNIGIARFNGLGDLTFSYYGSQIESLSSMMLTNKNYYDLLSKQFTKAMAAFHHQLFNTPCGAYVEDVISTASGSRYIFKNLQFPILGEQGTPQYMIVYANARKPADDKSLRDEAQLQASSIKTLKYIDLGAGAPSNYVKDYQYYDKKYAVS